jgi:hypothetical protein
MPEQVRVPVAFQFQGQARQVHLFAKGAEDQGWILSDMDRTGADLWELKLPLAPGAYRIRYYVNDSVQPLPDMDPVIRVPGQHDTYLTGSHPVWWPQDDPGGKSGKRFDWAGVGSAEYTVGRAERGG